MYKLLSLRSAGTNKKQTLYLKIMVGISLVWAIVALIISLEYKIDINNYWLFWLGNRAFGVLSITFALSSYYFMKHFPIEKKLTKGFKMLEGIIVAASLVILPLAAFTTLITGRYIESSVAGYTDLVYINAEYMYSAGSLSLIYGLVLIAILMTTIYISLSKKFNSRASKKDRGQSRIIVFGVSFAIVLGTTFQLILPYFIEDYNNNLYSIGQLAPIFMTFSAYYAVFRYRLFDIKNSAFRAVGYSLSIFTLVGLYSILIYGAILPIISPGTQFEKITLVLIAVGTVCTIYLYDKVKIVFDAITDKLFFKNSYSLPHFLDELNQALINSTDLGDLADSIMKVMGANLKTEYFVLVVKEGKFETTIDSRRKESLRETDAKLPVSLMNYHFKAGTRVVFRDYMNKEKFSGLYSNLNEMDLSAGIDLSEASKNSSSLKRALESGNFKSLLLGPKKSGESYNAQDLDVLTIIAKELVIALQNAMRFEEIKLFNLELQHKIDLATIKLRQQNKKLVVADELKDDFLSIASHQMRTPISAINGYASILNSGDAGKLNKDQQKFAKTIETSTKRLSYLINDFLTVSRLKSGKFDIEKSEVDLKATLKSEYLSLEDQFKGKDVDFAINIDDNVPKTKADEQKLRQVMMNLIDNALHYTNKGGKVEVTLRKDGKAIVFEVKDSGIGVPKEAQPELFSKMFRAGNAKKLRPDGTGLGLYLAKKVILGHHGHIIFESKEGEGSTFGFRIPI